MQQVAEGLIGKLLKRLHGLAREQIKKIDSATERKVRKQLAKGVGILKVAKWLRLGTGTVQRISLTVPPTLVARTDEVIE